MCHKLLPVCEYLLAGFVVVCGAMACDWFFKVFDVVVVVEWRWCFEVIVLL